MSMDSEKIEKKIPKIFRILGVVTDFQIDFLKEHQLLPTFRDLLLIDQVETFNLNHMTFNLSHITVAYAQKILRNYEIFMTKS